MDEILESNDQKKVEIPQTVKTLAILAYIGNGLWGLIFLIVFFWVMAASSEFSHLLGIGELPIGAIAVAILFVIVLCTLSIVGAYKMHVGKKWGFWLYLAGNGIWALVNLSAATPENIGVAAISIGFIAGFASNLKSLS